MRARDVLAYIDFVFGLMWREEHRSNPAVEWQADLSFAEMGWDFRVQWPGEVEPRDIHDELLPEYAGLLDVQLYWPGSVPYRGSTR